MALWLQSTVVLVVMALSSTLCDAASPPKNLCGSHLVEALYLVCGDQGFVYNPKRSLDLPQDLLPSKDNEVAEYPFSGLGQKVAKRGPIVDTCCHNPCDIFTLEQYCGSFY